ncbi:calcium-binding protein, partial [Kiloniella sp. b19]|uniref:calcium-binding protein n=1 Tax=Kiloniella sp. GXU_MW_B19 TaxID=3141326 RepID=UPI0031CF88A6
MSVNLEAKTASGGDAEGDTFENFIGVVGSIRGDELTGDTENNVLFGNGGNDLLEGGAGADYIDGGEGSDTASYASSNAAVTVDLEPTVDGDDTYAKQVSGGHAQYDRLVSIENLVGSAHADTLRGNDEANILEGGAGADSLDGRAGDDTLSYAGSDAAVTVDLESQSVSGGHAQGDSVSNFEHVDGSAHDDTLSAREAGSYLFGDAGDDTLTGRSGDDTLQGGSGADTITGGAGTDTLSYENSAEAVTVDLGAGTASGGDAEGDSFSGVENLQGSYHDDTLTGDAGDNVLEGDLGADTLDGGDGTDTASYEDALYGVDVSLKRGGGRRYADLSVTGYDDAARRYGDVVPDTDPDYTGRVVHSGSDLSVAYVSAEPLSAGWMTAGFAVDLGDNDAAKAGLLLGETVELSTGEIRPQSGAYMDVELQDERIAIRFYRQDGSLEASYTNVISDAKEQDFAVAYDRESGIVALFVNGDVARSYQWKEGLDLNIGSYGSNGAAVTVGATGPSYALALGLITDEAVNDVLTNIENLRGSDSGDILTGDDQANVIEGRSGNDRLSGEAGNDRLIGGAGSDSFDGGEGDDTLVIDASDAQSAIDGGAGIDTVEVEGDRGVTLDLDAASVEKAVGGAGNDHFVIGDVNNAEISGGEGFDVVEFSGASSDYSAAFDADGTLRLSDTRTGDAAKNGTASVASDVEWIAFSDGFHVRNGQQLEKLFSKETDSSGDTPVESLKLASGLSWSDVSLARTGVDLVITFARNGTDHSYAVADWFVESSRDLKRLSLDDGTVVFLSYLDDKITDTATALGDIATIKTGSDSAETLSGDAGSDYLSGGAGDDTLNGSGGDDVYVFGRGDGSDLVHDQHRYNEDYQEAYTYYTTETHTYRNGQDEIRTSQVTVQHTGYRTKTREVYNDGGDDILAFGAGITVADLLIRQDGTDLIVALKDPSNADAAFEALSDRIRLKNWTEEKDRIETFRFEDGSELTVSGIVSAVGTAGADVLTWSETAVDADLGAGNDTATTGSEADTLSGGAGDDTLDAGAGDDRLTGGTGNDTLIGGSGTDTYVYALGDGQDVIRNTDVAGRVELGAGIAENDAVFTRSGDDLVVSLPQDGRITVEGYFSSDAQKVSFALSDGSDLPIRLLQEGTSADETLTGTEFGDRLFGLGGADTLNGGTGSDYLSGGAGADTLNGSAGDDVYVFGRGGGSDLVHDEHRYSEDYQEAYTAYRTWTSTYTYGQDDKKGTRTHREAYTAYRTATR